MMSTHDLDRDTSPEARDILTAGFRAMSTAKKAELADSWSRDCIRLALVGIRRRYPDASSQEHRMRLGLRLLGPKLMREAYGWEPDSER
ncbi:hypothetical protein BH23ACT10_BH23ACT10_35990 [soil metagenome]